MPGSFCPASLLMSSGRTALCLDHADTSTAALGTGWLTATILLLDPVEKTTSQLLHMPLKSITFKDSYCACRRFRAVAEICSDSSTRW